MGRKMRDMQEKGNMQIRKKHEGEREGNMQKEEEKKKQSRDQRSKREKKSACYRVRQQTGIPTLWNAVSLP